MTSQQSQQIPKEFEKGFLPPLQDQESLPGKQWRLDPPPIDDMTADGKPYSLLTSSRVGRSSSLVVTAASVVLSFCCSLLREQT